LVLTWLETSTSAPTIALATGLDELAVGAGHSGAVRAWRFGWRLTLYLWLEGIGACVLLTTALSLVTGHGFLESVGGALWLTAVLTPMLAVLAAIVAAIWTGATRVAVRRRT
jgi:hypothetical protein